MEVVSVVVPCYEESKTVERLRDEVESVLRGAGREVEVIFVDDGSKDGTGDLIQRMAAKDDSVRAIVFSRNFGKEAAMLAGLRNASGDVVIIMDGDLQHPPEMIPRMLEMMTSSGVDQVVARRNRDGDGFLRTVASRLYYRGVNSMIDVELRDGEGDFRAMSRRAVDALLTLDESNRFSKGLFSWIGFPTETIEYANVARVDGESSWSFKSLINYGVDGILSFNAKPLRVMIYLGTAVTGLSVAYMVILLIQFFMHGVEQPGYLTTIAVITLFGGVQLLTIGVIGEYVGRIYQEVKRRPHYVIRERRGFPDER